MATFTKDVRPLASLSANSSSPSSLRSKSKCCCLSYLKFAAPVSILLWNLSVRLSYEAILYAYIVTTFNSFNKKEFSIVVTSWIGGYGLLGLMQVLYPIGGLIADVRYGRYKVIKMSLINNWLGSVVVTVIGVMYSYNAKHLSPLKVAETVTSVLFLVLYILGFGGFHSNAVQFGLDQLLDASSEELSLFLHWFVWTGQIGELIPRLYAASSYCDEKIARKVVGYSICFIFITLSTICLILVCWERHRFNCENNVGSNPYRNVYRVLKFTAKYGKPLGHRSALTYSDDVRPSRIDFAKLKYGGIFTTEVVEDVKTFLRILLMLLAITPMFCFEVSTSYLFPIYGLHLGKNVSVNDKCTYEWMFFESGTLSTIISVVAIPLYIILVYPHIKRWIPRIIYRMGIGMVLKVTSVITMFIIQVVANYKSSQNTCVFLAEYREKVNFSFTQTLEFPTQALVSYHLLNGIASPLINITVLEFISAQSPHTMKGLLLGVFYAFKGLFVTLGCVVTFPFAQEKLWEDHHGIFDCGFYYYLSNSVLGVIGLVVFLMAARQYQNRERDDPPYSHQYAEDYYSRYASRPTTRLLEEEVNNYGSNINESQ